MNFYNLGTSMNFSTKECLSHTYSQDIYSVELVKINEANFFQETF